MTFFEHPAMGRRTFRVGVFFLVILVQTECVFNKSRVIDETPMVITAVAGTLAVLPCSVDPRYTEQFPDQYKVVWVSPLETVISLQDRRVLNDMRISVERPFMKDWNLHLRNVSLTDAGFYKCQINTDPVGTKRIHLVVTEPPRIIDHSTPTDIEKPEGDMVELFCNASGTPTPEISWFRLHRKGSGMRERVGQTGESLVIHNISRMCGDSYECVASNGVEPAISQTFKVTVLYLPEVHLSNTRIGQQVSKDTVLDCEVSASPLGLVVWKHNGKSLANSQSHEVNLYNNNPDDSVTLSLRILKVVPEDFGFYECEATNPLGVTSRKMELFEIACKTSPSPTTLTSTEPKHIWTHRGHGHGHEVIEMDNNGRATSHKSYHNKNPGHDRLPHENSAHNSNQGSVMSEYQGPGSAKAGSKHSGRAGSDGGSNDAGRTTAATAGALLMATTVTAIVVHCLLIS